MKNIKFATLVLLWLGSSSVLADCQQGIPETAPDSAFMDHGNGLVTDTRTGLMWRQCTEGQSGEACSEGVSDESIYTWKEALQHVQAVNINSSDAYSDWRLPNKKELESIMANNCIFPAINTNFFYQFDSAANYWSSTSFAGDASAAWVAQFRYGAMIYANKEAYKLFIRLVRGGG